MDDLEDYEDPVSRASNNQKRQPVLETLLRSCATIILRNKSQYTLFDVLNYMSEAMAVILYPQSCTPNLVSRTLYASFVAQSSDLQKYTTPIRKRNVSCMASSLRVMRSRIVFRFWTRF